MNVNIPNPVTANKIGSVVNGAASATPNDTDLVMSVDTSVAKKNTWTQIKTFLKTYFDGIYQAVLTNPVTGTGTTNEIAYFSGATAIGSLAVATYPSLTELSYVKGITSAIQTQLNAKLGITFSSYLANTSFAPVDATTYYFGGAMLATAQTTAATTRLYLPRAGTIKACYISFTQGAGTSETSTLYIRLNNTTDTTVSSAITNDALVTNFNNTGLNISVTAGDYIEYKWITPTWSGNPSSVRCCCVVYME